MNKSSTLTVTKPQELAPLAVGTRDAARLIGVSERTLYSLELEGRIRCVRVGAKKLFSVRELARFLEMPSDQPSSETTGEPSNDAAE